MLSNNIVNKITRGKKLQVLAVFNINISFSYLPTCKWKNSEHFHKNVEETKTHFKNSALAGPLVKAVAAITLF